ncbi:hypothetical protein TPHA_0B00760 [Tetrapisispora phaffii CBS 4417]|uniref:Peroxin-19 n=1 Tax=Tetrapisispora phaffii (strain ATCC 24235 / CBS 4417 / NBRC 1672 / NRRL Y-8282 / UCD 70-5) TaxID=1071381 RepID=G8BQF1_TETPH|nr:hypothetical protein TPHA_0B00760 [Tetrapisispora phaffii CBS 4417]CCE61748.1 hypothetical protein TPHA_0B00760 [Tetrapisispora phaffii CBS 4417]
MTDQDYDDFDDLDDLLDEDPSKLYLSEESDIKKNSEALDDPVKTDATGDSSTDTGKASDTSQELKTMVEQLQSEFNGLMVKDPNNLNEEIVDSFKELMGMLNNTTARSGTLDKDGSNSSGTDSKQSVMNNGDFKNIVQSTLHKIRENGNNVDDEIKEEKKKATEAGMNNPNIIQDTLLNKMFSELTASGMDENIDDTILKLLTEMSNKDIIYQPMKDLYEEYEEFFEEYGKFEVGTEKDDIKIIPAEQMARYRNQMEVVKNLIALLELDDFNDTTHKSQVSDFLDELERLGESPMSSKFMKDLKGDTTKSSNDTSLPDLDKLDLENIDLKDIEKEMQESCPQQ